MEILQTGILKGHGGWVTSIATADAGDKQIVVSASRDKTLIKWDVSPQAKTSEVAGRPIRSLVGHSDFVQDVQISSDGAFALSGAWDNTLALWDLNTGNRRNVFRGHSNDVMSVAFSPDNRQIVSGSRDRSVKVWNTIAHQKYSFDQQHSPGDAHGDWVSCVRFSPVAVETPVVISGGFDGKVKVWSLGVPDWRLRTNLEGHKGYVNAVCISPDGSLCASGGKEGIASLWDLNESKKLYDLGETGAPINALVFSPNRYWLSVAVENKIKVFDLETRCSVAELTPHTENAPSKAECISLSWSPDGNVLYAGFTDKVIRVWQVCGAGNTHA